MQMLKIRQINLLRRSLDSQVRNFGRSLTGRRSANFEYNLDVESENFEREVLLRQEEMSEKMLETIGPEIAESFYKYTSTEKLDAGDDWSPAEVHRKGQPPLTKPDYELTPFRPTSLLTRMAMLDQENSVGQRFRAKREGKRKPVWPHFEGPVKVRVLDVDRLSLDELHNAFLFTLVKHVPAEKCIKVASRIGQFRDKHSHSSYDNMLRECSIYFGSRYAPELSALFSRCHQTISVPFMVDYIRRYGQFSKKYMSQLIEKSMKPQFFDFVRYQQFGGVKPLPMIVSHPYKLESYARMLATSTAKRYIFDALEQSGDVVPKICSSHVDDMPAATRVSEGVLSSRFKQIERPSEMDAVLIDAHMDDAYQEFDKDFIKKEQAKFGKKTEVVGGYSTESSPFALQFDRIAEPMDALTALENPQEVPMDALLPTDGEFSDRYWKNTMRTSFAYKGMVYAIRDGQWKRVGTRAWYSPQRRGRGHSQVRARTMKRRAIERHAIDQVTGGSK